MAGAHREVLDGMALAAVPAIGTDVGEEEEDQCSKEHDAHGHRRIVEVGRGYGIHSRQHKHHLRSHPAVMLGTKQGESRRQMLIAGGA